MNGCLLNSDEIQLKFAIANNYIPVGLFSSLGITHSCCPEVIMLNDVMWRLKDKHLKSAHYERICYDKDTN